MSREEYRGDFIRKNSSYKGMDIIKIIHFNAGGRKQCIFYSSHNGGFIKKSSKKQGVAQTNWAGYLMLHWRELENPIRKGEKSEDIRSSSLTLGSHWISN